MAPPPVLDDEPDMPDVLVDEPTDDPAEPDSDTALRHMFRRDFLYVFGGILPLALSAIMLPFLTRLMGPNQFGIVSFATAIYFVLQVFLSLGMPTGIQREYAKADGENRSRSLLSSSTLLIVVLAAVLLVTASSWAGPIGASHFAWAMRLVALWSGGGAISLVFCGSLRSRDRVRSFLVVVFVQSIGAQALGLALVIFDHRTARLYLDGVVAGQLLAAVLAVCFLRPRLGGLFEPRMLSGLLAFSIPLTANQLAAFILWSGDRIVVQRDLGTRASARYAVAYAVGAITINLISQLNLAWIPRVFAIKDSIQRRALLVKVQGRLLSLLFPAVIAVSLIVPFLLKLASPASYHPAGLVLVTLMIVPSAIPYSAALSNMRTLLANGQSLLLASVTAVCAVVNIVLNVLLVPAHGITGSAFATLVSYGLLSWLSAVAVARKEEWVPLSWSTELRQWTIVGVCLLTELLPSTGVWIAVRAAALVVAAVVGLAAVRRIAAGGKPGAETPDGPRRTVRGGLHRARA